MAELTLVDAINQSLHAEMARDERVMLLGEDVAVSGGVFRATEGLLEAFGEARVIDTPLAEAGIVGSAVGLCMTGMRPIVEMQFDSFSYPALDQMLSHVSRYRWRSRGRMGMPILLRMPYGGGVHAPELHEDSPEAYYAHTPGLKVVVPSTPADAKGLLAAAIRDDDPVVFLEPKKLYRSLKGEVPEGDHVVNLGEVRTVRTGDDVTLIAWGAMIEVCEAAADELAADGITTHICDVRTLSPLDEDGILAAVAATGRVVVVQEAPRRCSVASEIAATIAERGMFDLQGPVRRVTGWDVPYPYWSIEHMHRPDVARVTTAARDLLEG
ncbi:MAG: alpha-ketoacid dehydrogenase subunit beta [Thermoleophilia bacterium]|nr:alpha-ketoacid dehydrogenase subunit beta [Thermoleophilia bacterium]